MTHMMVPLPSLRVDGLPDSAQNPEGLARVLGDKVIAKADEAPDGRRCRVQLADAVLVGDLPHAAGVRPRRHPFEQDLGGAMQQRPCPTAVCTGGKCAPLASGLITNGASQFSLQAARRKCIAAYAAGSVMPPFSRNCQAGLARLLAAEGICAGSLRLITCCTMGAAETAEASPPCCF